MARSRSSHVQSGTGFAELERRGASLGEPEEGSGDAHRILGIARLHLRVDFYCHEPDVGQHAVGREPPHVPSLELPARRDEDVLRRVLHVHPGVYVQHPTKHILITPCWQLQTRYMRRLSAY